VHKGQSLGPLFLSSVKCYELSAELSGWSGREIGKGEQIFVPDPPVTSSASYKLCGRIFGQLETDSNQAEVTVLNPSDLLEKGKTCFSQKRYVRVID
jgi:hypothetical protein